jgi:tetratricopeptide (TPR) repeat protein
MREKRVLRMTTHRWIGPVLVATAVTLGATPESYGQGAQAPQISAEDDARALKLLAQGNKAFKAGKFADAESAYEQAFAVKKVHDIAANLGMAEFAQGKMRDAAEHLAVGLRLFPITGEPAQREQIQKTFDQCKGSVGAVKVNVNAKGALVYVDGKLAGEAPLPDKVFVEPGTYTFEAKADGYKPMKQQVTASKASTAEVTFNLAVLPKEKQRVIVEVQAKRRSPVPGIVMGVGAVVAAGAGGAFFGLSAVKQGETDKFDKGLGIGACYGAAVKSEPCQELASRARTVDTYHNVAIGAFVGAGVLAVGALTYLLLPTKTKPTPRQGLQAAPLLGPGQGGMIVSGAF